MAIYTAYVGNTDNSVIGDINVLKHGTEVSHTTTSATFTDPANFPGVTLTLSGSGFTSSPSNLWHITGVTASLDSDGFDGDGNLVWSISGITAGLVDGAPAGGAFDAISIFQAVAFHGAPDLIFGGGQANVINGGPGHEGLFGFGSAGFGAVIYAGTGTDRIGGDAGKSVIWAGTGAASHDAFLFNHEVFTGTNLSTIHHFNQHKDIIELQFKDFQNIHHFGVLKATEFHSGPGAPSTTGADIVYNAHNGHLYYDSNGHHLHGLHLFAVLVGHPQLDASDIYLI